MTAPAGMPVAGPGALSKRTDRQPITDLPDARYGEATDFRRQQEGAPLAKDDPVAESRPSARGAQSAASVAAPMPSPPITGLMDGTQRPGEPVTAGSPVGAGPGPVARAGINAEPGSITQALEPFLAGDETGVLNNLVWALSERGL